MVGVALRSPAIHLVSVGDTRRKKEGEREKEQRKAINQVLIGGRRWRRRRRRRRRRRVNQKPIIITAASQDAAARGGKKSWEEKFGEKVGRRQWEEGKAISASFSIELHWWVLSLYCWSNFRLIALSVSQFPKSSMNTLLYFLLLTKFNDP